MKYCKECGNQIKDSADFCPHCGTNVKKPASQGLGQSQKNASTSKRTDAQNKPGASTRKDRRPLSKKTKIILPSVAAFIVLLIGVYLVGNAMFSKEKAAEKFKEAVSGEDEETLSELLYSDDPELEVDEEAAESFLDYLKENPSYRRDLVQSISEQAENNELADGEDIPEDQSFFELKQNGKKWFLFDNYQVAAEPIYFTIETDYEHTELYINDDEVATADSDEFSKEAGPFLTGIYTIKGVFDSDFAEAESKKEIELDNYMEEEIIDVDLDIGYVSIEAEEGMEGEIVVNDEDTDMQLEETESIGPVPLGDSTELQIKNDFPWGEETSEPIPVEDSHVYIGEYPVSESLQETLMEIANEYLESEAEAYTSLDADKVSHASDDAQSDLSSDIDSIQDWDDKRKMNLDEITYDLNGFGIYEEDSTYYANLSTSITGEEDTYDKDDDPDLQDYDTQKDMSLLYDEDDEEWLVDEVKNSYNTFSDDTEAFAMDGEDSDDEDESDEESDSDDLDDLMDDYETNIIEAVNNEDFGLVEPYLEEGSELHESQQDLVEHLSSEGVTEELVDYEIKSTDCDDDEGTCHIDVDETVEITYDSDDTEEEDYNWTYTAKETDDGSYKLSKIEER